MSEAGEGRAQDLCQAHLLENWTPTPKPLDMSLRDKIHRGSIRSHSFERTIVPLWSPSPPSLSPIYVCELCGYISREVTLVTDFAEMWTLLHQARSKPLCEA